MLPILYDKATNGKAKMWGIKTLLIDDKAFILRESGYADGIITQYTKEVFGKNIGRANETTPYQQAEKEVISLWKKQIDKGYVESLEELDNKSQVLLPMLAHTYNDRKHDIIYPAFTQPKLNGVRCIANCKDNVIIYTSRGGKTWKFFEHLDNDIKKLGNIILDGEIFNRDIPFQAITRLVKKKREETKELEYWVYDCIDFKDTSFNNRLARLLELFGEQGTWDEKIQGWRLGKLVLTPTSICYSEENMYEHHKEFTKKGYEGTIIRNHDSPYVIKYRTKHLQKHKDFIDDEFTIIGGREATGEDKGTVVFRCATKSGVEFDVRPQGTREQRRQWFNDINNLKGKQLTVRYQDLTEDGKPQFPVGLNIRDYEGE